MSDAPQTTKPQLRAAIKPLLAALPDAEVERQSLALCKHLLRAPFMADARTLMVYAPLKREADVRPIAAAWAMMATKEGPGSKRRLCVPRLVWHARFMEPVEVRDWQVDLVPVRGTGETPVPPGLCEPRPDLPVVPLEELSVVLVPGLAFDRAGRRLGRGAGFYDRFLSSLPRSVVTVGVALQCQVVDDVPTEEHDVAVQWLATPGGVENAMSHEP